MIIALSSKFFDLEGHYFLEALPDSDLQQTVNRIMHTINLDGTVSVEDFGQSKLDSPYVIRFRPTETQNRWFTGTGSLHTNFILALPDLVVRGIIESYRLDSPTGIATIRLYANLVIS